MCEECEDTGRIEEMCGMCNGSGEGRYDGSSCRACKGTGVSWSECDCGSESEEEYQIEMAEYKWENKRAYDER